MQTLEPIIPEERGTRQHIHKKSLPEALLGMMMMLTTPLQAACPDLL